jgi:hypothetical protein
MAFAFFRHAAKPNYACASAFPELLDDLCAEGIEGAGGLREVMTPSPDTTLQFSHFSADIRLAPGNWPPEPMRCHPIVPAPQLDRKCQRAGD